MKRSTITLAAALMLTAAALKFAFPLGRTVPVYSSSNTPATAAAVQAKPETTDTASSYTVVTINAAEFLRGERASRETVSLPAAEDKEAFSVYQDLLKLAEEGAKRYTELYGPVCKKDLAYEARYSWLKSPWPWEYKAGTED